LNVDGKKRTEEKEFEIRIKEKLLRASKRLRGKYPPLSEVVNGNKLTYHINRLYELSGGLKQFYLIISKTKNDKKRYLICISLASQSSDLLVSMARRTIKNEINLRLLQFSLIPKHLRVNLLCLKEIEKEENLQDIIDLLKQVRRLFRESLEKLTIQMDND